MIGKISQNLVVRHLFCAQYFVKEQVIKELQQVSLPLGHMSSRTNVPEPPYFFLCLFFQTGFLIFPTCTRTAPCLTPSASWFQCYKTFFVFYDKTICFE
jgi:hypothetical protein